MKDINISAELVSVNSQERYAEWTKEKIETVDDRTEIFIRVDGYEDSKYLDMTPIFDIISSSKESVGDMYYLTSVRFNPNQVVGELVLSNVDLDKSGELGSNYEELCSQTGWTELSESVVQTIEYTNPPLIVGYCDDYILSVEKR